MKQGIAKPVRASDPPLGTGKAEIGASRSALKRFRLVTAILGIIFLAFAVVVGTRHTASTTSAYSPLLFHQAPNLSGETINGSRASLAADRGHFVVVNFFASWCVACRSEEPQLVNLLRTEGSSVRVLGVDFDDTAPLARRFLASYGASWPAISDTSGQIGLRWGVDEPPESFLISPSGKVLTKIIGPVSARQLEALITVATLKGY